jgi:hypothetical protein
MHGNINIKCKIGVHKTVTTASGTVQLPPPNVAKLGHVERR